MMTLIEHHSQEPEWQALTWGQGKKGNTGRATGNERWSMQEAGRRRGRGIIVYVCVLRLRLIIGFLFVSLTRK